MSWFYWDTGVNDGITNMAIDEATLEHTPPGSVILRTYSWDPGCLSLGCFQKHSDINLEKLSEHGFDAVRRATGGRAVLHHKELTYSIVITYPHELLTKSILESYYDMCRAIVDMLKDIGLDAILKRSDDNSLSTASCFTAPTFGDIEVSGKKIVGSAQMRTDKGLLQHGSIINSLDRSALFDVLTESKEKSEKLNKLSRNKMTSIEDELGRPEKINILSSKLLNSFKKVYNIEARKYEPSGEFWNTVEELKLGKYGSKEWTEKR